MGEILIADCETDGLLAGMTKLHMVQIGTADGEDVTIYCDTAPTIPAGLLTAPIRPLAEGIARLKAADRYIFHNGIGFDMPAINRFFPGTIERHKLLDTLVMARLSDPEQRDHRLSAWGRRTGTHKGEYNGDFQTVDEELLVYSEQDIPTGRALWHAVKHVQEWGESAALEHDTAYWISRQERNGFGFDAKAGQALDVVLRTELADLEARLKETFGPIERSSTMIPKRNNKPRGLVAGVPVVKTWMEEFNPASRAHVAERLQMLGWKPGEFGANGVATVDEKTLATLPYPEAKLLVDYFKALKRLGQLSDGKQGWLKAVKADGRIYGRVNPNGARTGRMSHSSPNVAQADTDPRMRSLWIPRVGWVLVGCDAEGIEARGLAHYLFRYDNGAFAEKVVNGSSEARTDVHSANLRALIDHKLLPESCWADGFKIGRQGAKTILYALIYGAGGWKLGETCKAIWRDLGLKPPRIPSREFGGLVRMALARSMVGIDKLVASVQKAAERGYLVGLDGRHIVSPSPHSALNTLLQSFGAVVMKKALVAHCEHWSDLYDDTWALCASVHDEVQMEARPDIADELGKGFAASIAQAGVHFQVRCELAGAFKIGPNWSATH